MGILYCSPKGIIKIKLKLFIDWPSSVEIFGYSKNKQGYILSIPPGGGGGYHLQTFWGKNMMKGKGKEGKKG